MHRHGGVVAPRTDAHARDGAVPCGEQGGVPAEQALGRQGLFAVAGGVQPQVHHAVHMPVGRSQRANVYAQSARDDGAHGLQIESLAVNLAGFDDVLRAHQQGGVLAPRQINLAMQPNRRPCARYTCASGWASASGSKRQ